MSHDPNNKGCPWKNGEPHEWCICPPDLPEILVVGTVRIKITGVVRLDPPAADEVEQIRDMRDRLTWRIDQTRKAKAVSLDGFQALCELYNEDCATLLRIVDQQRAIMPQVTELLDAVDLYFRKTHYVQQAKFDAAARLEGAYAVLKAALKEIGE